MRLTRCTARTSSSLRNRLTSLFDAAGNQTGTIDARGNLTQYLYDASNRSTVTIDAASNRTTQLLDSAGRVSGVLDGNNHLTQYLFDALNRASVTIDGDGHRTTSLFDGAGNLTGTLDGRGNLTQYLIDADNRASVTVDASSDRTTTLFDPAGNATVVIDGNGNRTTYLFDALNRATVTINADGYRTTQLLDAAGNLTGMVDADSNLTTFAYDGLNRKIGATNPQSYPATFMYNGVGMLTESIDALGRIIKNQYDADYRLTTVIWEDATGTPTQTFLFSYDAASNQTSAGNSVGTYTMMYDAVGRVSGVQELWNQQLTFSYDGVGNRTKVQDSFGGVTTNVFDNANNLATLLFSGTGQTPPMRTDLTYNGDNQIASLTRYSDLNANTNVAFTSYSYDPAGRLTNQVTLKGSDNSNIANLSYSYDPGGRVTNEITNGTTVSDAYDAANQLIGDGTTTVAFDGSGNRNNGSYQVGTENQVTQDATWKYTYDAAGNETKKVNITAGQGSGNAWVYTYDDGNELTKAELLQYDPAVYGTGDPVLKEVDYKYDAFGNMAERDDYPTGSGNPTVTRYAQDGWDPPLAGTDGNTRFNVWAELDGNNNLLTRYLHGDQPDQLFARQDSLVAYWYVTDNLGSVRDVLDNSGNIKDALSYDGWGNISSETNNTYRGNYAYTGRQWDIESTLQYDRARWYDPGSGRWQTQDPMGFGAGDSNLYRYARNKPSIAVDPSGLDTVVIPNEGTVTYDATSFPGVTLLMTDGAFAVPPMTEIEDNDNGGTFEYNGTQGGKFQFTPGGPFVSIKSYVLWYGARMDASFQENGVKPAKSSKAYYWVQYFDSRLVVVGNGKTQLDTNPTNAWFVDGPNQNIPGMPDAIPQSFIASHPFRDLAGFVGFKFPGALGQPKLMEKARRFSLACGMTPGKFKELIRDDFKKNNVTLTMTGKYELYIVKRATGRPLGYISWGYHFLANAQLLGNTPSTSGLTLDPEIWHPGVDAKVWRQVGYPPAAGKN